MTHSSSDEDIDIASELNIAVERAAADRLIFCRGNSGELRTFDFFLGRPLPRLTGLISSSSSSSGKSYSLLGGVVRGGEGAGADSNE